MLRAVTMRRLQRISPAAMMASATARTLAEIGGIVRTSTDWSSAQAFSEAIWPLNMTACSHALRLTTATVSEQSRIRSLPNMFQ